MSVALVVTGMSEPAADEETKEYSKIYHNKCGIKVYSQGTHDYGTLPSANLIIISWILCTIWPRVATVLSNVRKAQLITKQTNKPWNVQCCTWNAVNGQYVHKRYTEIIPTSIDKSIINSKTQ